MMNTNEIHKLGIDGVHKRGFDVYNTELSPALHPATTLTVDTCVQSGAPQKRACAGTMSSHPQSTALITTTILKYEYLMSITSHGVDKGRST